MSSPAIPRPASVAAMRRILRPARLPQRPVTATPESCRSVCSGAAATRPGALNASSLRSPPSRARIPRPHLQPAARSYHSHDHPPPPGPFTPAESALLSAAYKRVPEHGFTQEALALGARDAGLLEISPAVFPGDGVFALIRWHLYTQRTALADTVDEVAAGTPAGPAGVAERVERLTWERLRANEAIVGRWQEALAIMAQPSHIPASLGELAQLADDILYLAGDVSVDPSWYTKRASLSAIYAAAELFQTTDTSPGFRETRAFLQRRLAEAAQAGAAVRSVGQWAGFTAGAVVNVLRSKGLRI
ncbi:hypothetical protein VTJ83DRAFT_2999 [Remersonia thermophila]|uniref:Ubiquinone biosynthesis protein n=1 Tax=Remersonia thermophila TaxID=72144 RepID=A0ABR4DCS9_9PEZI